MQNTVRKPPEKTSSRSKERTGKDEVPSTAKRNDETRKKNQTNATAQPTNATPRNYVQKTTAADIYSQKKKQTVNPSAPKKAANKMSALNKSPMNDVLKSSPSSVSIRSLAAQSKSTTPAVKKQSSTRTNTHLGPVNVTVNSPPVKRRLQLSEEPKEQVKLDVRAPERQRQKTRTLKDDEVKVLVPEVVDNNTEMMKLSKNLQAKPKAFFVDLGDGDKAEPKNTPSKSSEDEVSYEDDFESYESDFESYHSGSESSVRVSDAGDKHSDSVGMSSDEMDRHIEGDRESDSLARHSDAAIHTSDTSRNTLDASRKTSDASRNTLDVSRNTSVASRNTSDASRNTSDASRNTLDDAELKGYDTTDERCRKDEERMLDSGSFELRESQRSANRSKAAILGFIEEGEEAGRCAASSLTDEGFQEMGGGSAGWKSVASVDGPLFLNFTKSKAAKRKRVASERLKQRASDILGMIKLHEMSYSLFEMKPIPYDLYMATFGRSNYVQSSAQTYDDGVCVEVQTDETFVSQKWTQFPVEFSKSDVHLSTDFENEKSPNQDEDYLRKFTFLLNTKEKNTTGQSEVSKEYINNPLRIYLEQKDGAGSDKMLPCEEYESKLKNTSHSAARLKKFLKKAERRISCVLTKNAGNTVYNAIKTSDLPFSKGYTSLEYKNMQNLEFLKHRKLTKLVFSETKSNLLMTVHEKTSKELSIERTLVCLWDVNVASGEPLKILVAIEEIVLCRFRGNTDGVFVGALNDGSIHLWDLSEEATILKNVKSQTIDVKTEGLTQTELDRDWNSKNKDIIYESSPCLLQACAYTSSAANIKDGDTIDNIVGLELLGNDHKVNSQDGGRKIVGQVCSLQSVGVLTIWMIVQEKESLFLDVGKAFWSKLKLEKNQSISLSNYVDLPVQDRIEYNFNLTAAKRRLQAKKQEKKVGRPKSSLVTKSDRPDRAANVARQKSNANLTQNKMADSWESGIVCTDLKVCKYNKVYNYLIAKCGGEVLVCTRVTGTVKIDKLLVASDRPPITCLSSSLDLPYFLAGTEAGAIHLCSLIDLRVLLTLDSRNVSPSTTAAVKYQHDIKGRYIGTVPVKPSSNEVVQHGDFNRCPVTAILWPRTSPCTIAAITGEGASSVWLLTKSDIHATNCEGSWEDWACSGDCMALLNASGELQIHKLKTSSTPDQLELFLKYAALL